MEQVKIKLPKEVASSMKFFIDDCQFSKYAMMRIFLNGSKSDHCIDGACLENYAVENYEVLLQALVNGYEVEETPEDKVREYFTKTLSKANSLELSDLNSKFFAGEYKGITNTLFLLNIKIEGIN